MRVAILIWCYRPFVGGEEVFAQQLADYLVKKGTTVDIITFRSNKSLSRVEVMDGVTVHRIGEGSIQYLSTFIDFIRALRCLLKLDSTKQYSLIHSVGEGLPAWVGSFFKALTRKPHLITVQGGAISGGFKKNLAGRISRQLMAWSFKRANLVHVISRSLGLEVRRLGAQKIMVLPNGFDSRLFYPRDNKHQLREKQGFSSEEKVVISVARLDPVKGVSYLVRAFALVARKVPQARLVVIGEGKQRKEIEQIVNELNLNGRARLLGAIPHEQIPDYLRMADVFVLPSKHEGLGIALIEAMACGLPVIGSNVDGIPDVIEDGKNGILVPAGDAEKLAEAIVSLLQDEATRNRFIQEGLKTVREKFLWETVLSRIEQEYKRIQKTG